MAAQTRKKEKTNKKQKPERTLHLSQGVICRPNLCDVQQKPEKRFYMFTSSSPPRHADFRVNLPQCHLI
ncbi:hypothetical protein PRUPE_1G308000 [Prunus persica]|uniref:Uncharacterized protein n=1 Tax=Prunus persica TaxID=3760 RepID=A0A251R5N5_PRUPE|nr:hypothetical protein PRUPE_1G308000 [Prunus persica]